MAQKFEGVAKNNGYAIIWCIRENTCIINKENKSFHGEKGEFRAQWSTIIDSKTKSHWVVLTKEEASKLLHRGDFFECILKIGMQQTIMEKSRPVNWLTRPLTDYQKQDCISPLARLSEHLQHKAWHWRMAMFDSIQLRTT